MNIVLKSDIYIVSNILKKTKAKFWKDLKVGDAFYITNEVRYVGNASSGVYATYYTMHKAGTDETYTNSQNELVRNLRNFEIVS